MGSKNRHNQNIFRKYFILIIIYNVKNTIFKYLTKK